MSQRIKKVYNFGKFIIAFGEEDQVMYCGLSEDIKIDIIKNSSYKFTSFYNDCSIGTRGKRVSKELFKAVLS